QRGTADLGPVLDLAGNRAVLGRRFAACLVIECLVDADRGGCGRAHGGEDGRGRPNLTTKVVAPGTGSWRSPDGAAQRRESGIGGLRGAENPGFRCAASALRCSSRGP